MKFTRVLALVLAGIMAIMSLASCGDATAQEITVTLKIIAEDAEEPILNTEVKVKSANPTVLEAFVEACVINEIPYTLSENEDSVVDIKDYKDYTEKDTGIAH